MRNIYLLFFFFLVATFLQAQHKEYKQEILKADEFLSAEKYNKAIFIYDDLLTTYPSDAYVQFKAGECLLFSEERIEDCIFLLLKVANKYPIDSEHYSQEAVESRFYLGQAYHLNYQFKKALKVFNDLRNEIPLKKKDAIEKLDVDIQYCKNAMALIKQPVDFKITNLGSSINTEFDEHSPVVNIQEDLLLFTSNRETVESLSSGSNSSVNGENVYYSLRRDRQWITSRAIDINTHSNNATIGISPDGTTLLVYQNDGLVGNIYFSKMKNDKWGELEKFPSPINSMANETHASFSMDGQTLFFSSDRSGGYGGKDIYKVKQLPNGEWGKVVNLGGKVNTIFDEESPYIHPSGNTLYFSSEGNKSMGGFDVFKATKDSLGRWGNVQNIGYPINTPFDDVFFAPSIDGQRVYYASKRDEGFGGIDIYMIEFPETHPNALAVVGGFLYAEDGTPAVGASIVVVNEVSGEEKGKYQPSPTSGKYIFIIPEDGVYKMEINYENHNSVIKVFDVPSGKAFVRKGHVYYLDPIVLKRNN